MRCDGWRWTGGDKVGRGWEKDAGGEEGACEPETLRQLGVAPSEQGPLDSCGNAELCSGEERVGKER